MPRRAGVGRGRENVQVQMVHCTHEWKTGSSYDVKGMGGERDEETMK
jgi:hypothetical protein